MCFLLAFLSLFFSVFNFVQSFHFVFDVFIYHIWRWGRRGCLLSKILIEFSGRFSFFLLRSPFCLYYLAVSTRRLYNQTIIRLKCVACFFNIILNVSNWIFFFQPKYEMNLRWGFNAKNPKSTYKRNFVTFYRHFCSSFSSFVLRQFNKKIPPKKIIFTYIDSVAKAISFYSRLSRRSVYWV